MHIAEPLFEAHHGLAAGGEAKMPGLDDPCMHRSYRNLMQVVALHGEKRIGQTLSPAPASMIEPRARVGRSFRNEPVQVANGALKPDRRRMMLSDRRKHCVV